MSTIAEIVKAAEQLGPDDFLKLRTALDRAEEKRWQQELGDVSARHRKEKLTDQKIDELLMQRRYPGRRR